VNFAKKVRIFSIKSLEGNAILHFTDWGGSEDYVHPHPDEGE
jgi:hypothetical protein